MELQLLLVFSLFLFLFMILKGIIGSKIQKRTKNLPPQPWKLPLIGHLHHLIGRLPHHTLCDLAKKHGPLLFLQLGEVSTIVVSSPRVAKEILKTQGNVFANRGSILIAEILSYGNSGIVYNPYGGHWRQHRKICTLELLSAKKVQSFHSLREEEVRNLVNIISLTAGSPVNLSQKMFSLVNDITLKAVFGQKFKEKDTFLLLMTELIQLGGGFITADLFPSLTFLHRISGVMSKLEKMHQKFDQILEDIINDHRLNRTRKEKLLEEDLVDVLIRLQEENELDFPIDDQHLKALIMEIFVTGSETSSTTLEWAMSELMRNPRIMEKAQAEVRHVFNGTEKVSQLDINELRYLKSVIKETFRLHPPSGFIPRESRERCEIDGYEIPKGTKVLINTWAIGRDEEYWSDAKEFIPERFEDASTLDYKGNDFKFLPFGAGKRICPGMAYGVANIELPLAQLLYHFDWQMPNVAKPEKLDMTESFGTTVSRKCNLYLVPTSYRKQ